MILTTFSRDGVPGAGLVEGDFVAVCAEGEEARSAVRRLVEGGPAASARWKELARTAPRVALADVVLEAPIPEPRRDIFCVGKNYRAHAAEFHASGFDSGGREAVPSAPVIFSKATTAVVGPRATIRGHLDPTGTVDYEGELGVVVGRRAFGLGRAEARDAVFGYTIINDVTSRELQRRHSQWLIGKGLDSFAPMGPYLVTADEIGDPGAMELVTAVNGEVRQKARVADLIFDIPTLIETLTATMTLLPGDIIATGTPAGVGIGLDPPRYLAAGDTVTVSISGLGELSNTVA